MNGLEKFRRGLTTTSAAQTRTLAAELAAVLPADTVLALYGDMGVGKTTFVQGLAQGLGVGEHVTSPTFAIYTLYQGTNRRLVHLDAYRLENDRQIEALLLEEFLVSPWCLAIEWPGKISGWLPPGTWHLTLSIDADENHRIVLQ